MLVPITDESIFNANQELKLISWSNSDIFHIQLKHKLSDEEVVIIQNVFIYVKIL